jgi:hypothetical protein
MQEAIPDTNKATTDEIGVALSRGGLNGSGIDELKRAKKNQYAFQNSLHKCLGDRSF